MKIDRLIGILSILLQKDSVTAPELAAHFEVSRRTISRDVEALSLAGIPVYTSQGVHGGISLMTDYKIDRTLLSRSEMQAILTGLRSLDSVSGSNRYGQLMEKLQADSSDILVSGESVLIDLSSWYKESLAPKIEKIRTAMDSLHFLEFVYYAPHGTSQREVEAYYLIFHWSSWYVWGYCTDRQDFRLFKLNRMEELQISSRTYLKRKAPLPDLKQEQIFPGGIMVKAVFEQQCRWRLVEEFGRQCFTEREDGRLLFQADYTSRENLISWLLTFGDQAELLEPAEIRMQMKQLAENIRKKYQS